jgi:L-lactate utilization protein LutB
MEKPVAHFWKLRLADVKKALEKNGFEAFTAESAEEAKKIFFESILPPSGAKSVSWGGSQTFVATGLYAALKEGAALRVIDVYDKSASPSEIMERRLQSLHVDLFITGANAVTEEGQLVNLDMIGNRIAALTFGPRNVVVFAGRNKVVADLDAAIARIKRFAAPANAMRLDKKTPCLQTGFCHDCASPDRICNTWTITEKSFPPKRVKVVLIDQEMGL